MVECTQAEHGPIPGEYNDLSARPENSSRTKKVCCHLMVGGQSIIIESEHQPLCVTEYVTAR